jgi:nucleosome assembly protein 1-like 1
MSAIPKKVYPHDDEDKSMEEEILKALKEVQSLPTKIKAMVLNTYLLEDKQLNLDLEAELAIITAKYKQLAHPLSTRANEIIQNHKPTEAELKGLNDYLSAEELAKKDETLANLTPIENYWSTVLQNSVIMKTFIQEKDVEVLKSLKSINYLTSVDPAKPYDFTLTFTFGPNEFFENEVLTKVYHMEEEKTCEKTVGTEIKWKEGKNTTKKTITKKQKNKKTGKTRSITKEVDCESFFSFFKTIDAPVKETKKEENEDDDEEAGQDDEMLDHLDFGQTFLDEILPYHIEYYLNIKKDLDADELGDDEDEDDNLDDEEEDDEEEAEKKPKAKKDKKKGDDKAQKPQCNQQ